jgi:CBS domain-containing protein
VRTELRANLDEAVIFCGKRVCEVMTRAPVTVGLECRAEEALQRAQSFYIHHLPVVARDRVVGILCTCDLLDAGSDVPVSELMTKDPLTVTSIASISDAVRLLSGDGVGCLPVTKSNRLVGIITRGDLQRAGLLGESECPRCTACGTHHHLERTRSETPFCLECLEQVRKDIELYGIEYGGGD